MSKEEFIKAISQKDYTEAVALITQRDPEAINVASRYGRTELHLAAQWGSEKVVGLLLSKMSAEAINAATVEGRTALELVPFHGGWFVRENR